MNGLVEAFNKFLSGYKTYIVAVVTVALAIAQAQGIVIPEWVYTALAGLGIATVRGAIAKK